VSRYRLELALVTAGAVVLNVDAMSRKWTPAIEYARQP
jgi:hypothetical protein